MAHFFVLVVIPLHIPCEYMIVLLSNQMGVSIEIYYTQHCNLLSGICRCTVINDTLEFYEFHHLIELSGNYNVHTINPHNPQALPHKKSLIPGQKVTDIHCKGCNSIDMA